MAFTGLELAPLAALHGKRVHPLLLGPATMSSRLAIGHYWPQHTSERKERLMSSLMVDFITSLDS
jgi:hypothetical protein